MGDTATLVGVTRAGGHAAAATSTLHSTATVTLCTAAATASTNNFVFHLDVSSFNSSSATLVVVVVAAILAATATRHSAVNLLVFVVISSSRSTTAALDTANTGARAAGTACLFGRHDESNFVGIFSIHSTAAAGTHTYRPWSHKGTPKKHGSQNNAKWQHGTRRNKQQDEHDHYNR
jgi:hypothetical protein